MAPLSRLLSPIILSLFSLQAVCSHPLDPQVPVTEEVPCEDVSAYDTAWFLSHTLPAFSAPFLNSALFYTRNMTLSAIAYARSQTPPLTTIWNVWPCYLYDNSKAPTNKMRCIHHDDSQRQTFYEAMSRAFAVRARGEAKVMHKEEDYEDPPVSGIWGRIELPTMKAGLEVDVVRKMDERAKRWGIAWRRFTSEVGRVMDKVRWSGWKDLRRKRDVWSVEYCMPWSEYGWFDNVEW